MNSKDLQKEYNNLNALGGVLGMLGFFSIGIMFYVQPFVAFILIGIFAFIGLKLQKTLTAMKDEIMKQNSDKVDKYSQKSRR